MTNKPFVVVSGLPASGKSTLAHRLAPLLRLPVLDKDDILNRLFEARGTGDAAWRRALSRESDEELRRVVSGGAASGFPGPSQVEGSRKEGAILVSFWRVPGMAPDSGTPTDWLASSSARLLQVHCVCDPAVAARRFLQRERHAGHLDGTRSYDDLAREFEMLAALGAPEVEPRIDVDTSGELDLDDLVERIRATLTLR